MDFILLGFVIDFCVGDNSVCGLPWVGVGLCGCERDGSRCVSECVQSKAGKTLPPIPTPLLSLPLSLSLWLGWYLLSLSYTYTLVYLVNFKNSRRIFVCYFMMIFHFSLRFSFGFSLVFIFFFSFFVLCHFLLIQEKTTKITNGGAVWIRIRIWIWIWIQNTNISIAVRRELLTINYLTANCELRVESRTNWRNGDEWTACLPDIRIPISKVSAQRPMKMRGKLCSALLCSQDLCRGAVAAALALASHFPTHPKQWKL